MRWSEIDEIAADTERRFGAFIRERVNPGAHRRDEADATIPAEILQEAVEIGLYGLGMPKEVGGGGADIVTWGATLEEIGRLCEDGSLPFLLSLRAAVASAIFEVASPAIVERYVRPMANGERFGSFAYSEDADAFMFKSFARKSQDGYELTGEKFLVTGGLTADTFMTYIRDENDDLLVFLVERDDPGVDVRPTEVAGVRAAAFSSLSLDHVKLPADRVLVAADGLAHAQRFLNPRRALLCCGAVGRLRAVLAQCAERLGGTIRYGRPLTDMQNVQASLGGMYVVIEATRSLVYRALDRFRNGEADPVWDAVGAAAKHFATGIGLDVTTAAMRLLGGRAYLRDSQIERYHRDVLGLLCGAGSQDVLQIDLGLYVVTEAERRVGREAV